jgi:hypothetical protein
MAKAALDVYRHDQLFALIAGGYSISSAPIKPRCDEAHGVPWLKNYKISRILWGHVNVAARLMCSPHPPRWIKDGHRGVIGGMASLALALAQIVGLSCGSRSLLTAPAAPDETG